MAPEIARQWLSDCIETHTDCQSPRITAPPSRLISVGDENPLSTVRLISTATLGAGVSWIALSYCWGGPQPIRTTTETIQAHCASIPVAILPATLRDAIHVTRSLGQCYLWVDCLCIIQDDDNDKAQEINKMPAIYSGATLTIVAARAETCAEGFLHDRAVYQPRLIIPTLLSSCQNSVAHLVSWGLGSTFSWDDQVNHTEPVETRGWTFQEHILSKRTLYYGTFEMTYACSKQVRSESSYFPSYSLHPHGELHSKFPEDGNDVSQIYEKWISLVEIYSYRKLTFSSDRLIAFSAIAQHFATACSFESADYRAGAWKSLMIPCLLWNTDPKPRSDLEYSAPSW
jgi:hypothetical protein